MAYVFIDYRGGYTTQFDVFECWIEDDNIFKDRLLVLDDEGNAVVELNIRLEMPAPIVTEEEFIKNREHNSYVLSQDERQQVADYMSEKWQKWAKK